ncbi:prolactin-releasing peptide [Suncus etruscus]|uniref:prolactin-releasing peptide n=1 Tax=Suncus etruscus TaxID=109475 RepID=UPI00210F5BD9|nr:prolactin-releasing peptide [Suncus etruscus]
MKMLPASLLCLVLLSLPLWGAGRRGPPRSMDIRTPDIDAAWYTGRGIRPVGRFGRRRDALEHDPQLGLRQRLVNLP